MPLPMPAKKKIRVALFVLTLAVSAGFSYNGLSAQSTAKDTGKGKKAASRKKADAEEEKKKASGEDLFLTEQAANANFLPDIYRCAECGYEQDEPGFCPDHTEAELVKVPARGRDPLEPVELDGNEDILVDIPLRNLEFRKDAVLKNASEAEALPKKTE